MTHCYKCGKALGADSIELGRTLCHDCRRCVICEVMLNAVETRYISDNKLADIKCSGCLVIESPLAQSKLTQADETNVSALRATGEETVTISRATYDLLNVCRRLCTPDTNVSNETNEQAAIIDANIIIANMTPEQGVLEMRKMQAAAMAMKVALLKRLKDVGKSIEDVERTEARKRGTELDRSLRDTRKAEAEKIEKAAEANLSPLERKKRRAREDGIKGIMQFTGLSREDATKQFDRTMSITRVMETQKITRAEAERIVDAPEYGRIQ